MADRSLKVYPQLGQQRRSQFFERRHPEVHFISLSENGFPQRGHFCKLDFAISKNPFKKSNLVIKLFSHWVTIHSVINHNRVCHSRESGNPGKYWIPPYQVRGRLSQARNDKPYKTYVVMYK